MSFVQHLFSLLSVAQSTGGVSCRSQIEICELTLWFPVPLLPPLPVSLCLSHPLCSNVSFITALGDKSQWSTKWWMGCLSGQDTATHTHTLRRTIPNTLRLCLWVSESKCMCVSKTSGGCEHLCVFVCIYELFLSEMEWQSRRCCSSGHTQQSEAKPYLWPHLALSGFFKIFGSLDLPAVALCTTSTIKN